MKAVQILVAAGLIGLSLTSCNINAESDEVVGGNCWQSAGERFGVDSWLLYSIAKVESSLNAGAININVDGSEDIGLMQINSQWFDALASVGIRRDDLFDPCININVGAWILKQSLDSFGGSWNGVGAYNAGTKRNQRQQARREAYAARVFHQYCVAYGMHHQSC